jgi:hypothetical protein
MIILSQRFGMVRKEKMWWKECIKMAQGVAERIAGWILLTDIFFL